jgi:hypothetical protein
MEAYKVETVLAEDGKLMLTGLPFHAGERIEVIVRATPQPTPGSDPYPLRGKPIRYENPTEPVAEGDWETLQ